MIAVEQSKLFSEALGIRNRLEQESLRQLPQLTPQIRQELLNRRARVQGRVECLDGLRERLRG